MRSLLFIGGPLIVCLGFALHSDLLTYGDQNPGMVHVAGVPLGGMFAVQKDTYVCDEDGNNCTLVDSTTEFSEVSGLELEEQPIEYREGSEKTYNKTKQPGLSKYTNIYFKRSTGFDWKNLKFTFEP